MPELDPSASLHQVRRQRYRDFWPIATGFVWLVILEGVAIVGDDQGWLGNPEPVFILGLLGMLAGLLIFLRFQRRRDRHIASLLRITAESDLQEDGYTPPQRLHLGYADWRVPTGFFLVLSLVAIVVLPIFSSTGTWLMGMILAIGTLIFFLRNGPVAYNAVSTTLDESGVTLHHRDIKVPWSSVRSVKATTRGVEFEIRGPVVEIGKLPRRWRQRAVSRAHAGMVERLRNSRPETAVRTARHYAGSGKAS
ncbi:MAG: hypothetical protein HOU81_27395 [Hamadaea sp.]|uniref:hypothetical protein n=1 Tax=Hamadaea sp. TaxID=2024425 RepID=UPI0017D8A43D|nr:hypothetical protein [Hamadaea sp.]NUR74552.1 hypothetical protein [Hamadaea sp.]NUT20800.1 hypothetical protein [Hamadaea sp.]